MNLKFTFLILIGIFISQLNAQDQLRVEYELIEPAENFITSDPREELNNINQEIIKKIDKMSEQGVDKD